MNTIKIKVLYYFINLSFIHNINCGKVFHIFLNLKIFTFNLI